jgi:hypothetical protein
MPLEQLFLFSGLTPLDQLVFSAAFRVCLDAIGADDCWCLQKRSHSAFAGFSTVNPNKLLYKSQDARPLLLSIAGQFQSNERPVTVRRSICQSPHCLNPAHYYWGTKADVAAETAQRNGKQISIEAINKMREDTINGHTYLQVARQYSLPYHVVRRICSGETYEQAINVGNTVDNLEFWSNIKKTCKFLDTYYSQESHQFHINYHVTNQLECPWHRNGTTQHKGNFGTMGECLDCMEEIKKGRCTVDVTKFDFRWYWTIKRFWDYVDIGGEDECWTWNGPSKKDRAESVAYFPSPFHSGKTQSATRVAFWVSRGYTGKYRVFSKSSCSPFCCNPKHLTIRELKDQPQPDKIETINLSYGNIFDHHRENYAKSQSSPAD